MVAMTATGALPWGEVNALDAVQVAEQLGLSKARERGKYACVGCASSNALHAYRQGGGHGGGFFCWSCNTAFSNVDAAAVVWGLEPAEACRQLAGSFGVLILDSPARHRPHGTRSRPRPSFRPSGRKIARPEPNTRLASPARIRSERGTGEPADFAELRADGCSPQERPEVYREVLASLTLTDRGAGYLRSRKLEPEAARAYGFRSVDSAEQWEALRVALEASFLPCELEHAGLWFHREGEEAARFQAPYRGGVPVLVLPYWLRGAPAALRFRRLDGRDNVKYLGLPGVPMAAPFNAPALVRCKGAEIHVTEGELDAWTATSVRGWRAVGLPGVSATDEMLHALAQAVGNASRVLAYFDNEPPKKPGELSPGEKGWRRFRDALQAVHGAEWIRSRLIRCELDGAKDLGELHQQGRL